MKILVSDDVSMKGVDLLRENGYEVDVKKNLDEQGLIDCIGEYDGLITRSMTHVTEKVIEAATKLKVIGRAGVGVDSIDLKSATVRGIVVVNTPTSNTLAATEHTCAMIMAITRHIPQAHNSLMAGNWDRKTFTGIQLQNKTIGIIGVGRIGSRIAKRMQAMEMKTIGYDPYIPEERFKQLGVEQVDLDTLFKRSDYITMHTPLTKETRGLIGKEEIAKMKDGVRVINVSRGAVLDIYALAEALKSGHVAGAAIDVFPTEPLTKDINPFLGMDNVVITPHLGASTVEAQIGVSVDVSVGISVGSGVFVGASVGISVGIAVGASVTAGSSPIISSICVPSAALGASSAKAGAAVISISSASISAPARRNCFFISKPPRSKSGFIPFHYIAAASKGQAMQHECYNSQKNREKVRRKICAVRQNPLTGAAKSCMIYRCQRKMLDSKER